MRSYFPGMGIVLAVLAGCGPLHPTPMPARANEELQREINASWNKALAPVNQLDRQELLDVLIGSGAYQLGVDRLHFLSEKQFAGGKVTMEVHFDRSAPESDRFEVTVFDLNDKVLRFESYDRPSIEKTADELYNEPKGPTKDKRGEAELREEQAIFDGRWKRIMEFFPKEGDRKAEDKRGI